MNPVNSRAKGAAAEREAAAELSKITTLTWERTAQRWGKATSDLWVPERPDLLVHVEVKHYAKGLARPTIWTAENDLVGTRDGLWMCRLRAMHMWVGGGCDSSAKTRNVHNLVSDFMAQAVEDAHHTQFPLVIMRQNRSDWIAVWRQQDDTGLAEIMLDILLVLPDEE